MEKFLKICIKTISLHIFQGLLTPTDPFQEQVAFLPMTFSQTSTNTTSRIFFYLLWKYMAFSFPISKHNLFEVCAICRLWPVSKLCPHFVFKRPRLNQIWPNFVFTRGFSTGRWPQNTARLSLKEYSRLHSELPCFTQDILHFLSVCEWWCSEGKIWNVWQLKIYDLLLKTSVCLTKKL